MTKWDEDSLDPTHGDDVGLVHEIAESARSGDENVAAFAQIIDVLTEWPAAVGNAWAKHGAITHPTRFVEDLDGELAGGDDNDDEWLSTHAVASGIEVASGGVRLWRSELLRLAHEL